MIKNALHHVTPSGLFVSCRYAIVIAPLRGLLQQYFKGGGKPFLCAITANSHYTAARWRAVIFRPAVVFVLFWIALFLLYLPAARGGWVSDTLGWLEAVRGQSFANFVMRKGFTVRSFYQLTQVVTWCLYQVFGASRWSWHLLQLSLHALNAALLYSFLRGLLRDSRLPRYAEIAFAAAALFCVSPYVSEVIVWEAAFHFLQGMLLLLLQLLLLRGQLHERRNAAIAICLFALSAFSLELFYLTPLLGAALCAYYRMALGWDKGKVRRALLLIVLPQAGILLLRLLAARLWLGVDSGRLGNVFSEQPITYFLVKPPECFFHLLGGRFLRQGWRDAVYSACSSYAGAGIFYGTLAALCLFILLRFRSMRRAGQIASLLAVGLLHGLALISPLWFPQRLLITGDRYLYVLLPPFAALLALGGSCLIPGKLLRRALFIILLSAQAALTLMLNGVWGRAVQLTDTLQQSLTDAPDRITILLNSPASLLGAPMIGAGDDGEAKLMHNLLYTSQLRGQIWEAPALHLLVPNDSIFIQRLDNRTIRVRQLHPGAFWQWGPDVARSYSREAYAFWTDDAACCYTLRLNGPPSGYRLLYHQEGRWRELLMLAQ